MQCVPETSRLNGKVDATTKQLFNTVQASKTNDLESKETMHVRLTMAIARLQTILFDATGN